MTRTLFTLRALFAMLGACTLSLGTIASLSAASQEAMPSCMVDVAAQPLAQAMPSESDGLALLAMRLTIGPEGGFEPHTHPGTVTVTMESGTLDFTLLEEDEMVINRAASGGTPVPSDPVTLNEEIRVNTGDWFVEAGSVHEAWNRSDEPAVLLVTALVDPNQPFVLCADAS